MANYIASLAAGALLFTAACSAGEGPAPKPAPAPAASPEVPRPPAAPGGLPRYVQAKDAGSLEFNFVQAGAAGKGRFRQFTTELQYDEQQLAVSRLKVTVQIASLDTQDKDRDDTLKSAELLDAGKFPTAEYDATSFARRGNGVEAVGKLTLHGVTRALRIPLTIRKTADGVEISGEATIKRLDYGVGQGDWSSTEWVGDEVKLQYRVPLTRAK
ncbi:MAG TPA: YceI family protein [Steroidobacteraceae bacterium]|jgi:polyisoprenoid-binding protein YceI|nr:YceI family protein [Steroidobacteraceae bacterium]